MCPVFCAVISREFSVERLMRFLTALGCEVDGVVRSPGAAAGQGDTIHLPAHSCL